MFTLSEVQICLEIFESMIKQQRQNSQAGASDETDSRLMQLVSINNKLTNYHASQFANANKPQIPRVLIVDDVDEVQTIVDDILYKIGFTKVVAVPSAEKAITQLKEAAQAGTPFKIVLTDDDMEGKSGIDLLKEIRLDEALANTDVFIMSTNGSQEQIVQAMSAGVSGYILKPLNHKVLEQKLISYLQPKSDTDKDVSSDTEKENQTDLPAEPKTETENEKPAKPAE